MMMMTTMTTMLYLSSSSLYDEGNSGIIASGKKNVSVSNDIDEIMRDLEHKRGEEEKIGEESPLFCCKCTASQF